MKRLLFIFAITLPLLSKGQTIQEILSPKQMTITWLGIDFTHGKYSMSHPDEIKKYLPDYCGRINKSVAEDHHRYFFATAYQKDFVYDTKTIDQVNAKIDQSVIVEKKKDITELDAKTIKQIISEYEFPTDLKGIGLVYIYESLSQGGNDKGTMWMVYINIETKEVLFLQNTTSGVDGRNLEESWAFPALSMIRKSKAFMMKWAEDPEKFNLANK